MQQDARPKEWENRSRLLDGVRGLEQHVGWLGITIIMMIATINDQGDTRPYSSDFSTQRQLLFFRERKWNRHTASQVSYRQKDRGLVSLSVCKDTGQQPGGGERSNLPFDVDAVTLRI